MKAVVLNRPHELTIATRPVPRRRSGEALLGVKRVGLCGSDLSAYVGTNPLVAYPRVPGHEIGAEILEIEENERGLQVGDLVCVEPLLSCGGCAACRRGKYNCCMNLQVIGVHVDGGMCEVFSHPIHRLHRPQTALSAEQLALCEPLSIGVQVNRRGGVNAGQRVVILGAGTIGLCALAVARTHTPHVLVIDKIDQRLQRAKTFGAECTVNADQVHVQTAVLDWTDNNGADVVLEAVGTPATLELTLDLVAYGGRIAVLGLCKAPVTFHRSHLFIQKEVDFVGSRNSRDAFPEVMELVESGQVDLRPLVTHEFPLEEAREAFALLANHPDEVGKCLLRVAD